MRKKIVAAMLASMMVVSLAACGGGRDYRNRREKR